MQINATSVVEIFFMLVALWCIIEVIKDTFSDW
jgi:hypothetical protein